MVSFEGGDQVGKADALLTLASKLLSVGISVTAAGFPIYATPLGNMIRVFLKEGGEKFGLSHRDELIVKMSLFALNRLEFLDAILGNDKYKDTVILFDRSSFSNAVTISYALYTMPEIKEVEIREMVDLALSLDKFMIDSLRLKECVVQLLVKEKNWKNTRGKEEDLHERKEVQKFCESIYSIYEEKVGKGWKKVITRENGKWRDRDEIFNEIYDFSISRYGEFEKVSNPKRFDIGLIEIIENMYKGVSVKDTDIEEYLKSIRENDKDLMYKSSANISLAISNTVAEITFNNREVSKFFSKILDKTPVIYEILEHNISNSFVKKLSNSLQK